MLKGILWDLAAARAKAQTRNIDHRAPRIKEEGTACCDGGIRDDFDECGRRHNRAWVDATMALAERTEFQRRLAFRPVYPEEGATEALATELPEDVRQGMARVAAARGPAPNLR